MKVVTYRDHNGFQRVGLVFGRTVYPARLFGFEAEIMIEFILESADLDFSALKEPDRGGMPLDSVALMAPIPTPVQDVICLGVNYMDHAVESAKAKAIDFDGKREEAVYFSKRVAEAVPCFGAIESHSDITKKLDYEAELAFIISHEARDIKAKDAMDYVYGYTIMNDVSARDIQTAHKQWYFGKSLDGFTPMGPWIVTKDELEFPPQRRIWSRVNGQMRQDSNTGNMIFDIPYIIEELSAGMTLMPGAIISTGTPAGVGMGMEPPCYLEKGDLVECGIDGIGVLVNTVV